MFSLFMYPYRRSIYRGKKKKRGILYAGIAIALVVILSVYILFTRVFPETTIIIIPHTKSGSFEETVFLDSSIDTPKEEPFTLPTRIVSIESSESTEVLVTRKEDKGSRAKGIVKLINKTGKTVEVAPGDSLRARNNQEYTVTRSVTIPAAEVSAEGEIVLGEILSEVIALEAGEKANINTGIFVITSLEPNLQSKVYGEIQSGGITGGKSELKFAVNKVDRDREAEKLKKIVREKMFNKFRKQLSPEEIIPEELLQIEEIVSTEPELEEEATSFMLTVTMKANGLSMSKDGLVNHINNIIQSKLDKTDNSTVLLSGGDVDSYKFEVRARDVDEGKAEVFIKGTFITRNEMDIIALKREILGKTVPEARRLLLGKEDIKDVKIITKKSLKNVIPKDEKKVTLKI